MVLAVYRKTFFSFIKYAYDAKYDKFDLRLGLHTAIQMDFVGWF